MTTPTNPILDLGWAEWLSLPCLDLPYIAAKVDTGAKTSCIHAFAVEPFEKDGETWLNIGIHPVRGNSTLEVWRQLPATGQRTVRDSGGHEETRWAIQSEIGIGGQSWMADITLTSRDSMQYRMLLGRTAMAGKVRVLPGEQFLLGSPNKEELKQAERAWDAEKA
jgi:hypothetical protein